MNKTRTLGILVGILAVINIGLLTFLWMGPPNGPGPDGFRDNEKAEKFIQEKFGFEPTQMDQFHTSKKKHMEISQELQKQLETLSGSFYLAEGGSLGTVRDSLLLEISTITNKIYSINVTHFDEVRSICTPSQIPEMENFINGLLGQRSNHRDRKRKNERK